MEEKGIDCIGLLYYNWEPATIYSLGKMIFETQKDYIIEHEGNVISFISKATAKQLFIILGQEIATSDGFHILSIGAVEIESGILTLNETVKEIINKGGFPIIDHPYADAERAWKDIDSQKEEILEETCKNYKDKIGLEWNGYCNRWARYITHIGISGIRFFRRYSERLPAGLYSNVNRKTDNIGRKFSIPVIPTSDLNIKDRWSLDKIGTGYIEIPDKDLDFRNLINSIKENILSFNFSAHKKTVNLLFFFYNYGIPTLQRVIKK